MSVSVTAFPPGPSLARGLPDLLRLRAGDTTLFEDLHRRYGNVSQLKGPRGGSIVMAFHPDDVQRVLLDNKKNYPKGKRYAEVGRVLGQGLVNSEGELWQRQRRLVQDLFTRASTLKLVPIIVHHAERLVEAWKAGEAVGTRDVHADMVRTTFDIAGESFLGAGVKDHAETIREALPMAFALALARVFGLFNFPIHWPLPSHIRFRRLMSKIDRVVDEIIDSYRGDEQADNFLVRLLKMVDPETGRGMDRRQVRDELKTILIVSHETSAVTMTWALSLLAQHPEVRARAAEEVDRVLGGADPTPESLERMPYLHQFMLELLRVRPSIPVLTREAVDEDRLGGFRVTRGQTILIAPWMTHRHPDFWKDPERFDPERFENFDRRSFHRCAFLPFGAGPRSCIGELMGQLETKIVVVKILQKYDFELAPGFQPKWRGFITLAPANGMPMTYRKRPARPSPELPQNGCPHAVGIMGTP